MKIFNTMDRRKEEFVPLEPGKVRMYVCGPTVYNFIHIGNARPMIFFDTVRRYFQYKGYDVRYVSNFTDVDDKIIKAAEEEGVSASEIAERYIKECRTDMAGMNIEPEKVGSEIMPTEPYMLGSHSGCCGIWTSGPEEGRCHNKIFLPYRLPLRPCWSESLPFHSR